MTVSSSSFRPVRRELDARVVARVERVRTAREPREPAPSARVFQSAIRSGDFEEAVVALRLGWFELLNGARAGETREALDGLSSTELAAHPLLALALGLLYSCDDLRRSKASYYFGLADAGTPSRAERWSAPHRALALTAESAALRVMGKPVAAIRTARAAVELLETTRDHRDAPIGSVPGLFAELGTSLYYGGRELEALAVFERGCAEAEASDPSGFGNIAMTAGIHALAGNLAEAADVLSLARSGTWGTADRSERFGPFYRVAEAVIALECFDPAAARRHIEVVSRGRRTTEHWVPLASVQAMAALLSHDPAGGLSDLESFVVLRGAEAHSPAVRHRLSTVRLLLHLALGNHDAAATVLRRDGGSTPQDHVNRARLALVRGRTSDALRELRIIAGRIQSARTTAEALSIEAAVGLRTGGDRRTKTVLQQLASVLRRSRQRLALHLLPHDDFDAVCDGLRELAAMDVLDTRAAGSLLARQEHPALTARESAVLEALSHTASLKDMAAELFVSPNTVKSHLKSLYRKLGVRGREEALTVAMHRHLLSPRSSD